MRACLLLVLGAFVGVLDCLAQASPTKRFLAIGDSITAGFGDPGVVCERPSGGYPQRLQRRLRQEGLQAVVENHGVCGETTLGGLSRIDDVLENGGDVLLIMEGTNDLSMFISLETMRFNIAEMARKALAKGIAPVYAAPIPRRPDCGSNTRTEILGDLLAMDAQQAGYPFADPFHAMIGVRDLYENFYSDPWHPNAAGYDLLAEAFVEPALAAAAGCTSPSGPCEAGETALCLSQERFKIEVAWRDFEGNTGIGRAVPQTGDTGMFWFFDPANIELVLKVLDGSGLNGHFWVFYGALSNVQYEIRVTDTQTGRCRRYFNPSGALASVGDTEAFTATQPEAHRLRAAAEARAPEHRAGVGRARRGSPPTSKQEGSCVADATRLCLNADRFEIEVTWRDFEGRTGQGQAVPLTGDSGYFWFFDRANIELVIKALDGRAFNGHFWVFYGALSNVEYTITVRDSETGQIVSYFNAPGIFGSRADTEAFLASP